jgi:outer membrane protein assembly factor BamE (lipoprotein component of BamABCDE complex)
MHALFVRLFLVAALFGAVTACSPNLDLRGNQPLPENLSAVKSGRLTKSDVASLIGTPATTSLFGDDHWYYISSRVETWAFFKPEEQERQVVVIDFSPSGVVSNVRKLGLADGTDIAMAPGETPAAGKELSLLEQLIGNVGKFNSAAKDKAGGP